MRGKAISSLINGLVQSVVIPYIFYLKGYPAWAEGACVALVIATVANTTTEVIQSLIRKNFSAGNQYMGPTN